MNTKIIKVYDTITGKIVGVEVTEKVYKAYTRTEWGIKNNDNSFFEHEIQFSQIIGGDNGSFENFSEFILDGDPTASAALEKTALDELLKALKQLDRQDQELIHLLYFSNMTERSCAKYYGISCKNIHKKKVRILLKLYKLIKK